MAIKPNYTQGAVMLRLLCFILIATFCLPAVCTSQTRDDKLSISISKKVSGLAGWVLGDSRYVYLEGEIDSQAGKRLEAFITENNLSYTSSVVLNSPGGSLLGGIEIGRVIRKFGLKTTVGKRASKSDYDDVTAGECMSACTLAYLGGKFRLMPEASKFGVHRFYWTKKGADDADVAQMLAGLVTSYMKDMDVDVELFRLSTLKGGDEILEIDRMALERLNVVNNGFERPRWSIEGANNLVYLKGERDTIYGINKFIIYCAAAASPILHVIFDPQGREDEVMHLNKHDLVIDGRNIPIAPHSREIKNGWFNGIYPLNARQTSSIVQAKSVGMILRHAGESPIFLGFDHLPLQGGEQKVSSFLASCQKRPK